MVWDLRKDHLLPFPHKGRFFMYFQLGWRNIWRNPRRTTVIMLAVIIGVWSMIFLGALMRGMLEDMIENGIATLTGHIQVHRKGYREDPVVENSMTGAGPPENPDRVIGHGPGHGGHRPHAGRRGRPGHPLDNGRGSGANPMGSEGCPERGILGCSPRSRF